MSRTGDPGWSTTQGARLVTLQRSLGAWPLGHLGDDNPSTQPMALGLT